MKFVVLAAVVVSLCHCRTIPTEPVQVTKLEPCPVRAIEPSECNEVVYLSNVQGTFVKQSDYLQCRAIAAAWFTAWKQCKLDVQP